jgi:hypothetical protein
VEEWYMTWAGSNALTAAYAKVSINHHSSGLLIYRKRFGLCWTCFNAWVVVALSAQMGNFKPWYEHEDPDPGRFRPYFLFMI